MLVLLDISIDAMKMFNLLQLKCKEWNHLM